MQFTVNSGEAFYFYFFSFILVKWKRKKQHFLFSCFVVLDSRLGARGFVKFVDYLLLWIAPCESEYLDFGGDGRQEGCGPRLYPLWVKVSLLVLSINEESGFHACRERRGFLIEICLFCFLVRLSFSRNGHGPCCFQSWRFIRWSQSSVSSHDHDT